MAAGSGDHGASGQEDGEEEQEESQESDETQEEETDLVPTTTMVKEFVEKLEGIVDAHAELQMQREVYMSLIRRVKSHFDCLGVCWR